MHRFPPEWAGAKEVCRRAAATDRTDQTDQTDPMRRPAGSPDSKPREYCTVWRLKRLPAAPSGLLAGSRGYFVRTVATHTGCGTVLGSSSRAELQRWTVDLDRQRATCDRAGQRQASTMARRVDVVSIADEIADRIVGVEADDRLTWLGDGRVRLKVGKIFAAHAGYQQTVQGRRKRSREALIGRLSTKGCAHLGRNMFEQLTMQGS